MHEWFTIMVDKKVWNVKISIEVDDEMWNGLLRLMRKCKLFDRGWWGNEKIPVQVDEKCINIYNCTSTLKLAKAYKSGRKQ
jgi:hypothetical protein